MSTPPAPTLMTTTSSNLYDYNLLVPPPSSQPPPQPHLNPILITILVFSVIIIAVTFLYLLFRHLHSISTSADQSTSLGPGHRSSTAAVTPLPLFTFSAVVRNSGSDSDCAICLSKFHPLDKLRLLPLCCHAFHAVCIDTWLHANKTCPLCRSSIHPSDSNIAAAFRSDSTAGAGNGSFRLEIGSVRRQAGPELENAPTAYSIGSFQYIVDGESEVIVPVHHRSVSVKDESGPLGGVVDSSVAGDAAGERNWLGEYVDRLSATVSYSRRFFTGSSRRSEVSEWPELDGSRVGEEISEWFRWASGV